MYMKRILVFLAAALAFAGCNKSNDTPNVPESKDFTIEQKALTQGSIDVRITPKDNEETYYFNVITKKDFKTNYQESTEALAAAYKEWFGQLATQAGLSMEEFLKNALLSGMQNYQFRTLVPETEYVFFVYGVDYSGNATTDVDVLDFTTPKAELNKDATFTITPTEIGTTYFKVKISCSDPNVFYYYDVLLPSVYEQYCGSDPANIPAYMSEYLSALKSENDTYAAMSEAEFISHITTDGEIEYDTATSEAANSLVPEMEFPVFAIGIANDGTFTTNATVVMVKTAETPKNDWIISDEVATDIQYNATITPAYDEAYAVILERKTYFEGATDAQMVDDLLAARKGSFMDDLYITRAKVQFTNLIPNEDYYMFMIACTPDGLPKTGDKLNVKKYDVKTKAATATGAVYSINVFNVSKTSAQIEVTVNTEGEGQTFLTNYITKAELEELSAGKTESEALKGHMDALIDARLNAWNDSNANAKMDRKEFLSRLLPGESKTGTGNYITVEGLTAGTTYYAYVIGIKADGTYTTEPFKKEFSTIASVKSKISLSIGMTAWIWDEIFPNETNYTVRAAGEPYANVKAVYCKYFTGNDEWAGKTASEISELLQKEPVGLYGTASAAFRIARGTKFFVYFIGVDVDGITTDITKVSHTAKAEGSSGTGMGKNVSIDKTETIAVR